MWFSGAKRSPIGVELGSDAIRLLQIEWRGDVGQVIASAEIETDRTPESADPHTTTPFTPEVAAAVRKALDENGFRGRKCVGCVPADRLIQRHVKVDEVEGQALRDALLFELEDAFPGDAPMVQHLDVGEVVERGERRHEMILLAAGHQHVNSLVDFMTSAGLDPIALDAEGCALVRCFLPRDRRAESANADSDGEKHTAIVHVGALATQMTITGGGQPLFMKQLPLGATQLFEALQQRLELSESEVCVDMRLLAETGDDDLAKQVVGALRLQLDALALELSACLRYHAASRRSPGGIDLFLSGQGARIPGLADTLSETLGTPVQRPDPFSGAFSGVVADARIARRFALWAVPLGLALRESA